MDQWHGVGEEPSDLLYAGRRKKEDTLLVVCNFSNVEYDDFRIGVPYPGKYKEMFNSDAEGLWWNRRWKSTCENVEKNRV